MNIIGLFIENFKNIRGARLDFDGERLVQIRGHNGAGKSALIEAIEKIFKGGSAPGVVTTGAKKATLIGKFGEYTATKIIKEDGTAELTVKSETAGVIKGAQGLLNELAGKFIDPVRFAELTGKEARAELMKYSSLDFTLIDAKIFQKETARTLKGQEVKKCGQPTPCAKVEAVSVSELLAKRKEIEAFNESQLKKRQIIIDRLTKLKAEIVTMIDDSFLDKDDDMFQFLGNVIIETQKYYFKEIEPIKILPSPEPKKPTDEIDAQIAKAEETNTKANAYAEYTRKRTQLDELEDEYAKLTEEIKALRQERSDMLKNAKLPLKGLEITDTNLAFNGIAYDTLSTSERLKIAITLAVHYSGELRTIYIKRGECMDAKSLAKLKEAAEKNDFQVFMEIVDDSYSNTDDGVVYIKEGEIIGKVEK